jgi:hypothetical protein
MKMVSWGVVMLMPKFYLLNIDIIMTSMDALVALTMINAPKQVVALWLIKRAVLRLEPIGTSGPVTIYLK